MLSYFVAMSLLPLPHGATPVRTTWARRPQRILIAVVTALVIVAGSLLPAASADAATGFVSPVGGHVAHVVGGCPAGSRPAHEGVDINGNGNTPVYAAASGTVDYAVNSASTSGYGTQVVIRHTDGYTTRYAHMIYGSLTVSQGATVSQGQRIGTVGNTGNSTGAHMHFEIKLNGSNVTNQYFWCGQPNVTALQPLGAGPTNPTGVNAAPTAIIDSGDRISLYAVRSDGNLWGTSQANAGSYFAPWQILAGQPGTLQGRPAVVQLSSGIIAIYARTSAGYIVGTNQVAPGGSFTPWTTIGVGGAGIASDPVAVQFNSGAIGVYAMTDAGYVAGTAQGGPGGAFSSWTAIGTTATVLGGRPALVHLADDRLMLFAKSSDGFVHKTEQTAAGGAFTAWSVLGTGGAQINSEPIAVNDQGRVTVYAAAGTTVSSVTQDNPGGSFNAWLNLGAGPASLAGATPFVILGGGYHSVYTIGGDRLIWGTSIVSPPATASAWSQIGSGSLLSTVPVGIRTSSGVNCVYAASNGAVVGTCQSGPGGYFGTWSAM